MYAIMNEEPEPITGLRTGIPMEMERIINKILAKEPAERYQGTVDLMVDLKKIKSDSNSKTPIIKQKTKPEKTLQISRKSLTTAATLLLGIIVLLIVYFLFIGKTEPETPSITPTDKPSLAVLRFKNHTGEKNLDHWRSGFPELLIIDLSQSKFMQVLRSEQMSGIIRKLNLVEEKDYSEEQLYQIASQGKIDHILSGSYLKAGNQYVITAMLQNMASGEVISTGKFRADGEEEIFTQIDRLSREIKTKLKFSQEQIRGDIDDEIGKITTNSPQAYKFFLKGMEEYRHSETFRAIQYFRKAIDIDPEFAMAYRFLAVNYNNIGKEEEYKKNTRKAFEKYNRLSVRERYLIQGDFYRLNEKNHGKAIDAYKKLLEFYPDDNATNRTLGYLYFLYEKFEKALKFWEKNLTSKFSVSNDYYNIMELYMIKGRDEEVKKLAAYYLENISEDYAIRLVLARLYITRGNFKKALTECEKLSLIRPEAPGYYRQKGYIYLLKDDWTKAKDIFLYLADREDDRAIYFGRGGLATLYLTLGQNRLCQAQLRQAITQAEKSGMTSRMLWLNRRLISLYNKSGKRQRALEECNKAYGIAVKKESLREEKRLMLLKGIILLNLGSTNSAKKMAEQLKEVILNGLNEKEIRLYHLLTGLVNLKQENLHEAIKSLKDACGLLPRDVYFSPFLMGYNHAMFLDP
ncbi:MAG: hypothetical protein KAT17_00470, partial [Candidatus Aminicenantes bacterium]|nr:hypothetical protein [Candidatus Aminicenantes bacterium]